MSSPLRRSPRLAGKAPQQLFEHPWPRQRHVRFDSEEQVDFVTNAIVRERAERVAAWFCPLVSLFMLVAFMVASPHMAGSDILRR